MPPRIFISRNSVIKGFLPSLTTQTQNKLSSKTKEVPKNFLSSSSNEKEIPIPHLRDLIGPADSISNIRKVRLYEPPNETKLHKRYRLLRQETLEWQHNFWLKHNTDFTKEREEYTKNVINQRYPSDNTKTTLNADEMSKFYKDFLDSKWSSHLQFNVEWQKRNFTIVFLSMLVRIQNATNKIF